MYPIRGEMARRSREPSTATEPRVGDINPAITRRSVDFPAPLSPSSAYMRRGSKLAVTPRNAAIGPKFLVIPFSSIALVEETDVAAGVGSAEVTGCHLVAGVAAATSLPAGFAPAGFEPGAAGAYFDAHFAWIALAWNTPSRP